MTAEDPSPDDAGDVDAARSAARVIAAGDELEAAREMVAIIAEHLARATMAEAHAQLVDADRLAPP